MHVGMCAFFQNLDGQHTDREVYQHELAMADLAEPLGFESIWAAEHHFTPYDMCPSTTQFLTYMAGRTRGVQLGSMVVVLPWHDPVRVAEEIAVLDHVSGGRVILGLGRGLARAEFDGFRVPMAESRERFVEYAEAILDALETGEFANAGLATIKGYEYYGALARNIEKHGEDRFVQFLADLQVWGTPDQVYERIREHQRLARSGMLIGIFSYGGMPHDEARRNMRLFAEKVLPRVQALDAP